MVLMLMLPQCPPPLAPPAPPLSAAAPLTPSPPLAAPALMDHLPLALTMKVTPPIWAPQTPPSTETIHQYCLRKWHLDQLVILFASLEVGCCNAHTPNR